VADPTLEPAHFWARVAVAEPEGCWEWLAGKQSAGYGRYRDGLAHRAAFEFATGIHPGRLQVCHTCDNPLCCNPAHLFLGDNRANMEDKMRKGRGGHTGNRLQDEDVFKILGDPRTYRLIAAEFGVSATTVGRIKRRQSHRWTQRWARRR